MRRDPVSIEKDGPVCDILMKQVGKPKDLILCKASNLWDNRYRIDMYVRTMVNGCEGRRIAYSCFAHLEDKELIIKQEGGRVSI